MNSFSKQPFINKSEEDVFILGAGFSKAIADYPTANELLANIKEEFRKHPYFNVVAQYNDLEFMLSDLYTKHPHVDETEHNLYKFLYGELLEILIRKLTSAEWEKSNNRIANIHNLLKEQINNSNINEITSIQNLVDKSSYLNLDNLSFLSPLNKLLEYFFKSQKSPIFISFNYDTLIEQAYCTFIIEKLLQKSLPLASYNGYKLTLRDFLNFSSEITYSALINVWLSPLAYSKQKENEDKIYTLKNNFSFDLYKLHGSLELYWNGSPNSPIKFGGEDFGSDLSPLIIPPILDKAEKLIHPFLQYNWSMASNWLSHTNRIFVLGYSFPPTDFSARSILFNSQFNEGAHGENPSKDNLEIYIVNVSDERNRDLLVQRVKETFQLSRTSKVKVDATSYVLPILQKPIEKFIEDYTSEKLQQNFMELT
ncbi:MAG: hypothetical protein SFU25_11470 [Candidatus Caenarcaniphilales bacterium]|nr:hypothetical protein [Candidatus Caenarcaniphilales bacterium]